MCWGMKYDMIRTRFLEISNFGERRRKFCDWKSTKTGGKENEKNRTKKTILAAVCLLAFSASAAFASNAVKNITVYYQDIKIVVMGSSRIQVRNHSSTTEQLTFLSVLSVKRSGKK